MRSAHVQAPRPLVREGDGREARVTPFELFFDLVYVFAVTQLSHQLVTHLDLHGATQTLLLLLAVWAPGSTPPGRRTGSTPIIPSSASSSSGRWASVS